MKKNKNKNIKSYEIIILCLLVFFSIIFLACSFRYKRPYTDYENTEGRYIIPSIKYGDYEKLKEEVKDNPKIYGTYVEKVLYYLEENPWVTVNAVSSFNALGAREVGLISGRYPGLENEVIVSNVVLSTLNHKEINVNKEGHLVLKMGDTFKCNIYEGHPSLCDGVKVKNVKELDLKVVGVYGTIPSAIYKRLDVETLKDDDIVNVILRVEANEKMNAEKFLEELSLLTEKYSVEKFDKGVNNLNYLYVVGSSEWDNKNFPLDNKDYSTLMIIFTLGVVFLTISKVLKKKWVIVLVTVCAIAMNVVFGASVMDVRQKYINGIFFNRPKITETVIIEDEDFPVRLKEEGVNISTKDEKLYYVEFNNYKEIEKYYNLVKNRRDVITIDGGLSIYSNEFLLIEKCINIDKLFISYVLLTLITIVALVVFIDFERIKEA